ncbi:MAG: hypothetical protein E6R03_04740 [Hyphomicrobiaceae bacterium]|nr:MAG: hypothetical protein E6R03_04740 [Hyphomicrobiaceae bacterium]
MNLFQWSQNTPTGVFRNQKLSNKLYEAAISKTVFVRFAQLMEDYSKGAGETYDLARSANLAVPTNLGELTEDNSIPIDRNSMSKKQITIAEFGRGVQFTSKSKDLSRLNLPQMHRNELMKQMRLCMDQAAANAFKSAQVKYTPLTVGSGSFNTSGSFGTAAANLNFYHLERARDYAFGTLKVPGLNGEDDYCLITSWKGFRGLRDDPQFAKWNAPQNANVKFNGSMGKIENVEIVVTNNTDALSASKGTGGVLGESVLFGADAVAEIVAEQPELRMANTDFERKIAVAWYGMYAFDIIWDTGNVGEAKIIHIGSA